MKVYQLKPDADRYRALFTVDGPQASETHEGASLASTWTPALVRLVVAEGHEERPVGDFPTFNSSLPALSAKAAAVLKPLVGERAEFLPLRSADGEFVALNVTRVVPALDVERSDIKRFPSTGRIMRVVRHEFRPQVVAQEVVFRDAVIPHTVFVQCRFATPTERSASPAGAGT